MLTTEQMQKIIIEETTGVEPKQISTPEADVFRESVRKDMVEAKANGWVLEIPSEWEVDTDDK